MDSPVIVSPFMIKYFLGIVSTATAGVCPQLQNNPKM